MTGHSDGVEITHDVARDDSICGVFCDADPEVSFEAFGYTFHRCRDCYEGPCSRCWEPIPEDTRGSTREKGWCEDCREEVSLLVGDDERGIKKDEDSEQTTLMTDGGQPHALGVGYSEADLRTRERVIFVARHLGWADRVASDPNGRILHDPEHEHHDCQTAWPRQYADAITAWSLCSTCFGFEGTARQLQARVGDEETDDTPATPVTEGQTDLGAWSA